MANQGGINTPAAMAAPAFTDILPINKYREVFGRNGVPRGGLTPAFFKGSCGIWYSTRVFLNETDEARGRGKDLLADERTSQQCSFQVFSQHLVQTAPSEISIEFGRKHSAPTSIPTG